MCLFKGVINMGTSSYSVNDWNNYVRSTRLDTAVSAQQIYRSNYILPEFDPKNIKVRESCDSKEFPITTPIIIGLDVTGSMDPVLMTISKSLNDLMLKILNNESIPGPHLMFMGIGDACYDSAPLQVTQFESDIKIAEQMNKIWFEQGGGGNGFESYDLAWYFARYYTRTDSLIKRNQKGILFTIGDDNPINEVHYRLICNTFGIYPDFIKMPIKDLLKKVEEQYDVYHLIIKEGTSYSKDVFHNWKNLLHERAIIVDNVKNLSDIIYNTIAMNRNNLSNNNSDYSEFDL